jgi:hypothetical protein
MLVTSMECGNSFPSRQPLKMRGRTHAIDDLRARCKARLRDNRQELLDRLRAAADEDGVCTGNLRAAAREVVMAEVGASHTVRWSEDEEIDEHELLALEEALLWELEYEAQEQAIREAEQLEEEQNAADCELYEQHLLGGVPCPLCNVGRLSMQAGEVRCTNCTRMRAAVMDEGLSLEMAGELLCLAEERHRHAGCCAHASFDVKEDYGPSLLFLTCGSCGWCEVVL